MTRKEYQDMRGRLIRQHAENLNALDTVWKMFDPKEKKRMDASKRLPQGDAWIPEGETLISFEDAIDKLDELQRFKATVYAINGLLMAKGYYSHEEYAFQFRQSAQKQLNKTVPVE